MANEKKTPVSGGNKPKPGGPESAKDKSRAQSRAVPAKTPAGRPKGGNTPRPGGRPGATAPPGRSAGTLWAWGAVGLVVVVIAVVVIAKIASGNSSQNASYTPVTPAPAQVVRDVTTIPASVYNQVGVSSSQIPVAKPTIISGNPPMSLGGASPAMLYYGAEYCPFCAAERWPMTAALSRFGTWSNLQVTASSPTDVAPNTHTFSYRGATLTSPYITFRGIEACTNIPDASSTSCSGYRPLQSPTKEEAASLQQYSSSKYLPNTSSSGGISFPFVNVNDGMLVSGASYDPTVLAGLTWTGIASGLDNPTDPITQAIVATANYLSAGICQATKGQPGSVCTSPGVQAAAKALGISAG